jgi:anti-anti-sigma regulatory factor
MGPVITPQWSRTRSCATLSARHRDGGASWLLELSGEADIATLGLLRRELAQMARMQRADVVVDVTGLAFCDVASAESILAARRTNPVTVIGARGTVKRVFDLLDALQRQGLRRYPAVSHTPSRPLMSVPLAV